jgi:hypothetical protein
MPKKETRESIETELAATEVERAIARCREVVRDPSPEALGAGSCRVSRRRHADSPASAFLTGLGTAVGPASRLRRRYADAPAAASIA